MLTVGMKNQYAARCGVVNLTLQISRYPKRPGVGRAGEGPEVEAWLEALNASATFCDSVFGPGVTEGAGATDWRMGEAQGVPGISSSPGRGCQEAWGGGGSVLQPQLCRAPHITLQPQLLGSPTWGRGSFARG